MSIGIGGASWVKKQKLLKVDMLNPKSSIDYFLYFIITLFSQDGFLFIR